MAKHFGYMYIMIAISAADLAAEVIRLVERLV